MNDKLNKHLAEKVMGWELQSSLAWPGEQNVYKEPKNDSFWLKASDWNPSENLAQAHDCLATFEYYGISKQPSIKGFMVRIFKGVTHIKIGEAIEDLLPMAISLASEKAAGWEE